MVDILSLFFPKKCMVCKEPLEGSSRNMLCDECEPLLVRVKEPFCNVCGREFLIKCNCNKDGISNRAVFYYVSPMREIIYAFKYGGKFEYGRYLADMMYEAVGSEFFKEFDWLAPVPIHPKRLKERGFNQAMVLAKRLGKRAGVRYAELLERNQNTTKQTKLSFTERSSNVSGTFVAKKIFPLKLKKILLVDDIFTTGSTVNACAQALKAVGAQTAGITLTVTGKPVHDEFMEENYGH